MRVVLVSMDPGGFAPRGVEAKWAEHWTTLGHEVTLVAERAPVYTPEEPQPKNLNVLVAKTNTPQIAKGIARRIGPNVDAIIASSISGAPIVHEWRAMFPDAPAVKEHRTSCQVLDVPVWRLDPDPQQFKDQKNPWREQWRAWITPAMELDTVIANTRQTVDDLTYARDHFYDVGASNVPTDVRLGAFLERAKVVYYGIDTEAADAAPTICMKENAEAAPGTRVPDKWVVALSRLAMYKGFDLAFAALSLIPMERRPMVQMIGGGGDAGEPERLMHLAILSQNNVLTLAGLPDAEKFGVLKGSDLNVYLEFNASLGGQSPVEAAYCGVTSVVADTPIKREKFSGVKNVVWVDPFDTRAVAEAIDATLMRGPATKEIVEADQAWIRGNRSVQSHAEGLLKAVGVA